MKCWEEFEGGTPRALRFPLVFPLRYRPDEDRKWHQGRGANISRSGLLFRAEQPLALRTPVEVTFVMPARIPGESPAEVLCWGRVVRQAFCDSRGELVVAATIDTYRFQRSGGHEP